MRTDDIANAFKAIAEEAEALKGRDLPEDVKTGLGTIASIARHQKDVRTAPQGSCKAGKDHG